MKRQMGLNQEKYTKELQDNLAQVDTFKKIYGNSFYSASILYNVQCHKYQFQPVKYLIWYSLHFQLTCKDALLERMNKIIEGMKPMFEALEAVKADIEKVERLKGETVQGWNC